MDKATHVFNKLAIGIPMATAIGIGFIPKPRKTITGITSASGKDLKMKELINLPKK